MNEGLSQEPFLSWVDAGQQLRLLQMANRAGNDGREGHVETPISAESIKTLC